MNKYDLRGELRLSFGNLEENNCIKSSKTGKRVLNCDFKTEQGVFIKFYSWNPEIIDGFINGIKVELINYKLHLNTWEDKNFTNSEGKYLVRKDWRIECLELVELDSNEKKVREQAKASRFVGDKSDTDKVVNDMNWELDLDDDEPKKEETLDESVRALKDLM